MHYSPALLTSGKYLRAQQGSRLYSSTAQYSRSFWNTRAHPDSIMWNLSVLSMFYLPFIHCIITLVPVHVQDCGEIDRIPVKEILGRISRQELITKEQDLIHSLRHHQAAQAGGGMSAHFFLY